MRGLLSFALVAVFAVYAGIGFCQGEPTKTDEAQYKEVLVDRNQDGKMDEKDIYDKKGRLVKKEYDTNDDAVMDRWETYDPETGILTGEDEDRDWD